MNIKNYEKNFSVGPAKLFPNVAPFLCQKLQDGTMEISHRSPAFTDISKKTIKNLRSFFNIPEEYKIFYLASSTESWEVVARGCINNSSTHITNGNFGELWKKMFEKTHIKTNEISHHDWRTKVEINEINPKPNTEFLALTANETSTGISYSNNEIKKLKLKLNNLSSDILLGIDITSSMGGIAYDFTLADIWHFSVQKGLGLPAGLGILIVGPRAWNKYLKRNKKNLDTGCHHSLGSLENKMTTKFQTPTTPNFLAICGLGFVCQKLSEEFGNIINLEKKIKNRANRLYTFFNKHPKFSIVPKTGESKTILVLESSKSNITKLHKFLDKHQIIVAKGYGKTKHTQIRIGNFPAHSDKMFSDLMIVLKKF
jgi:phosphoserine aminotransferase